MTVMTPESTPANRVLPHLRSELSRVTHRRLYRILALLLIGGIAVVSVIAFFQHQREVEVPAQARAEYERALRNWERDFESMQKGWEQCVAELPEGATVESYCGPAPDFERDKPQLEWFAADPRYLAKDNLPVVVIAVIMASAMLAFILGASSGGAEWSSRSMTLQLLWEPRRLRLLSIKWLALALVTAVTTTVALALGLALAAATASMRGSWDGVADGLSMDGGTSQPFWPALFAAAGRGVVLTVVVASFAYAIAMLVRNTGAALGVAFVYFAVVENAIRIAFLRFGAEQWMLSTNSVAFVVPGGLDVPGRIVEHQEASGDMWTETVMVHVSNGRALLTLLVFLAVIGIPAVYSFTRRDVG